MKIEAGGTHASNRSADPKFFLEVMVMAVVEKTALLDKEMSEVFDWSDKKLPVRDALWDHFMESNGHNTDETEASMKEIDAKSDDEVRSYVEDNLKK
jgi:hypothetical protein